MGGDGWPGAQILGGQRRKHQPHVKADGQTLLSGTMNSNWPRKKRRGLTQVGVKKSSGFCVIFSYFQLPISIAIQSAQPTMGIGMGSQSLPPFLFPSLCLPLLSLSLRSLGANPLSPHGGSWKSPTSEVAFLSFTFLCVGRVGSPPARGSFQEGAAPRAHRPESAKVH